MISIKEMALRFLRRYAEDRSEPVDLVEQAFRDKDIVAITSIFEEHGIENYTFNSPPVAGPLNVLYGRVSFASEKDLFLYNIRGGDKRFSKLVLDEFERNWHKLSIAEKADLYKKAIRYR